MLKVKDMRTKGKTLQKKKCSMIERENNWGK